MEQEVIAIIKWQYWLFNHGEPKEIIKSVFPDLWEHLYDKYNHYANRCHNSAFGWVYWFMDLSADRQEKFAAWVMENYHGVESFYESKQKACPNVPAPKILIMKEELYCIKLPTRIFVGTREECVAVADEVYRKTRVVLGIVKYEK